MILIDCNSIEYLNEIGYISPTDILDIIPISYGMEIIKKNFFNEDTMSIELESTIQKKLSEYFYSHMHHYQKLKELKNLDKVIVFYISSDDKEIKDVVFCIICNLEYSKDQLLILMKRYSKLRAFV